MVLKIAVMLEISDYCGGICSTNGYLVRSGAECAPVVIDAPEGITDWISGLEVVPAALLLTHQHFDHVEDAAALVERFGVPVYAWSEPSMDLTLEDRAKLMGVFEELLPYPVDHLLEGGGELRLEGSEIGFEILHVPGHSPDSICFHHPDSGALFGGDVLMCGGYGRTDFPHGSESQLFSGICEKLWPLDEATSVFSGHGPATTIGDEKRRGLIP